MAYIFMIIIFMIIIIFLIINKLLFKKTIENFCKINNLDPRGGINDKRVLLDFPPQSDIFTSSCDKYWKDWPLEVNNTQIQENANVIKGDQLELPKEKQFGNNDYKAGLVDFKELAKICSDSLDMYVYNHSKEKLMDPITKEKLEYQYQMVFTYSKLNQKTWIDRWYNYNPSVSSKFEYDEIKSPIEDINILNMEFKSRLDKKQKILLTKKQLLLFGLLQFQIFKYKILHIQYYEGIETETYPIPETPIYMIEIMLFRETDLYVNTFSYIGYIKNNKPILININYIGRNSTDHVLLANFYNPNDITQEIINSNFSNASIIEKDPDAIVALTKKHQEDFKIKNQYACFNFNYDPKLKNQYILPYYSREQCESMYDFYGKEKEVGIFDTPCKENKDCPFFQINKNYENDFGKCKSDGYCELPVNMKPIGYRYYKTNENDKPLCYNCNANNFRVSTVLGSCCEEQFDKQKYHYLKTPDYAFNDDFLSRKNFFNNKFCKSSPGSFDIKCENIAV